MADVLNSNAIALRLDFTLGIDHPAVTPQLRLFTNDDDITCDTLLADLTECSAGGYGRITLVPADWVLDYSIDCQISASYPVCTFTLTDDGGGETIYGHMVVDTTSGEILWAANWTTPFVIPSGGGVVEVYLFWTEKACTG